MTAVESEGLASAREWLRYAREDLEVATRSMQPPPLTVAVYFHAQQAGEKALKAYWTYLGEERIPRTHHLPQLAEGIVTQGGRAAPEQHLKILSAYPVDIRYPEVLPPTEDEAQAALESAQALIVFVTEAVMSQ